jgi:hypothetical protein
MVRETHNIKGGFEKIPLHPIISLRHVSFNSNEALFTGALVEIVENLIG